MATRKSKGKKVTSPRRNWKKEAELLLAGRDLLLADRDDIFREVLEKRLELETLKLSESRLSKALSREQQISQDHFDEYEKLRTDFLLKSIQLASVKEEALRVIDDYRKAGGVLSLLWLVNLSFDEANSKIMNTVAKFGFDKNQLAQPMSEMLKMGQRKLHKSAFPRQSDNHLKPFTQKS